MYGKGISKSGELLDLAVEADVVNKSGAWFSYDGTRLGQGRDNVKQLLESDAELSKSIEEKLLQNLDKIDKRAGKSKSKTKKKGGSDADDDYADYPDDMPDEAPDDMPDEQEMSPEEERAAKRKSVAEKKANIDILVED